MRRLFLFIFFIFSCVHEAMALQGDSTIFAFNAQSTSTMGKETFRKVGNLGVSADADAKLIAEFSTLANQGQPEALNVLGWLTDNGYFGVVKNPAAATQYFLLAAKGGLDVAKYNLATQYFWARGVTENLPQSLDFLNQIQTLDTAGRVCGLKSYITFRLGKRDEAYQIARTCTGSGLSLLALAYGTKIVEERNEYATKFSAISPEIYPLMLSVVPANEHGDRELCVWMALAAAHNKPQIDQAKCFARWHTSNENAQVEAVQLKQRIESSKQLQNIAYSRSIPYLPFPNQSEIMLEKRFHNSPLELLYQKKGP